MIKEELTSAFIICVINKHILKEVKLRGAGKETIIEIEEVLSKVLEQFK